MGDGVRVDGAVSNTLVGGTAAGAGNLISANAGSGIAVVPAKGRPTTTTVEGNILGTDVNRSGPLPNGTGISVTGATATSIGGTDPGPRNFVWNSKNDGIDLADQGSGGGNRVVGNDVQKNGGAGVSLNASGHDTVASNAITSNAGIGVSLTGSTAVTIGGTDASAGNTISGNAVGVKLDSSSANTVAFNTITGNAAQGVIVSNAKGDKITANSISANLGLGIDLDTTAGTIPANDQIAAPVLLSVTGGSTSKTAKGIVFGNPNTPGYTVELFANPVKTAGVPIQGGVLIGSTTVDHRRHRPGHVLHPLHARRWAKPGHGDRHRRLQQHLAVQRPERPPLEPRPARPDGPAGRDAYLLDGEQQRRQRGRPRGRRSTLPSASRSPSTTAH